MNCNKDKSCRDTNGRKVIDKNSVEVAKQLKESGRDVTFLAINSSGKSADLLVDGNIAEVKGITSKNSNTIATNLKEASKQIKEERARFNRKGVSDKIIVLSKHDDAKEGYKAFYRGYRIAKRKGHINYSVEFWRNGKIFILL